jgi:hypothetical protein
LPRYRKPLTLADPKRFKTIQDLTRLRPDCGASIDDILVVDNGLLIIIDLSHLGNILNSYDNPSAAHVRTHGVVVGNEAHPGCRPIFWRDPFLLLPLSSHLNENLTGYAGLGTVVGEISHSSGSLLFIPVRKDMPALLGDLMSDALAKEPGMRIMMPDGTYRVFYEQFEAPDEFDKERYRNIVVMKQ